MSPRISETHSPGGRKQEPGHREGSDIVRRSSEQSTAAATESNEPAVADATSGRPKNPEDYLRHLAHWSVCHH